MCYKWGNPWGLQEESQISPSPLLSQWRFMPHHLKLSQVAAVHCCSWAHSGWWGFYCCAWTWSGYQNPLLPIMAPQWQLASIAAACGPTVAAGILCGGWACKNHGGRDSCPNSLLGPVQLLGCALAGGPSADPSGIATTTGPIVVPGLCSVLSMASGLCYHCCQNAQHGS